MKKRVWILFSFLTVAFTGVTIYMCTLIQGNYAQVTAEQNSYSVSVASLRGTIYDRQLRPLVNSEKVYRAATVPDEALLPILRPAMDEKRYQALLDIFTSRKPTVVTLNNPIPVTNGLRLFLVPQRYGSRLLAPHLIGYLNSDDSAGIAGLEKAYDELLQSNNGQIRVSFAVDGTGVCLHGVQPKVTDTTKNIENGLVLTIDRTIQQTVEDMAPSFLTKGAVIVMNPTDGAILALASFPTFQPDTVAESISKDDGALINRALSLYDCGSVFKIVTAAAALESGVSTDLSFICAGGMDVGTTRFHCHQRLGHQRLSLNAAFAQSCNLYFIQLAQKIGAEKLYAMIDQLGFLQPINFAQELGSNACVTPDMSELLQSPAALANLSFGQGKLLVSPLHVAQMTAVMANGGTLYSPYVVRGTYDQNTGLVKRKEGRGKRALSVESVTKIRKMMELVVTEGTGLKAKPTGCTAAGKTGTAETGQRAVDGSPVVQSWFTGYIPAENPQYVITILAEDAENTNASTAQLFCEISNKLME